EARKAYGAFVLSALIGWLIRAFYPSQWFAQEPIRALGEGFLVAGVIGFFIEMWSASVIIEHVAEELTSRLVGAGLPKTAQELIRDIVDTKLVYRDYRKTYKIVTHPEKRDYVRVEIVLSYAVVNNGTAVLQYAPRFMEEGIYNPSVAALE